MKDDSIVKSFRVPESMFEQANEIFKKEGFSLSEVIRVLFQATIREGRVPRGMSTREMETQSDAAKVREDYMNDMLTTAIPSLNKNSIENRILDAIFGKEQAVSEMSNADLREWASTWGLPDTLSIATLADLYESEMFEEDPWGGIYDAALLSNHEFSPETVLLISKENLKRNLQTIMSDMEVKSITKLLQDYTKYEEGKTL